MIFTSLGCPYAERPGQFSHLRLAPSSRALPPGIFKIPLNLGTAWWEAFDPTRQVRPIR